MQRAVVLAEKDVNRLLAAVQRLVKIGEGLQARVNGERPAAPKAKRRAAKPRTETVTE